MNQAHRLIQGNVLAHFQLVPLSIEDYRESLGALAGAGWVGGLTYDALLLRAAEKGAAEQVYTLNVSHFQRLAHCREWGARIGPP